MTEVKIKKIGVADPIYERAWDRIFPRKRSDPELKSLENQTFLPIFMQGGGSGSSDFWPSGSVTFSLDPTSKNGYINHFHLEQNINQNQQIQVKNYGL